MKTCVFKLGYALSRKTEGNNPYRKQKVGKKTDEGPARSQVRKKKTLWTIPPFQVLLGQKNYAHAQRGSQNNDSHRIIIESIHKVYSFTFIVCSISSSVVLRKIIFLSLSSRYIAGIIRKSK